MIEQQLLITAKEALSRNGYCFVNGFDQTLLLDLAGALGSITMDPRHPTPVRFIRPQDSLRANPNTLSSRYGLGSFPFHTDAAHWHTPATFILLYCVATGSGHRPTLLIDSHDWNLKESEWNLLCRAVWRTGFIRPFLCSAAMRYGRIIELRYDPGCMVPRSPSSVEAERLIKEQLTTVTPTQINWNTGDLLVLDNRRMLHARGQATKPDQDRVIVLFF